MAEKKGLSQIYSDIKSVKIQGATNIARAAVRAWCLSPGAKTGKKLLSLRPTEPMLAHVVSLLELGVPESEVLEHFEEAQRKMNKEVEKLLSKKRGLVVMTHCHSTNVLKALLALRKKGKKFSVVHTEARPLYQGRKTARDLSKAGVPVETFVDSGMDAALEKADVVLLGADALLRKGLVNKIGSEAISRLAFLRRVPVWVVADSWKFAPGGVKIEERDFDEVWSRAPKHVRVRNPAFEFVPKRFLKGVISELGRDSWGGFLGKVGKNG